jgi:serine/threonine protein kinase
MSAAPPSASAAASAGGVDSSRSGKKRRPMSLARTYADVNAQRPASYWDYEKMEIEWSRNQDDYEVIRKIGRGKYSEVFEGINVKSNKMCVIKVREEKKRKGKRTRGNAKQRSANSVHQ